MALVPSTSVGGSGSGSSTLIFDSTLAVDTANIDTGVAGVSGSYSLLEIYVLARTDDAGATASVDLILNGDTSAIYDMQYVYGVNASPGAGAPAAGTKWVLDVHGSGGSAGYATALSITIPGYAQTTFWKSGTFVEGRNDATATNEIGLVGGVGYRSTTAISQIKIAAQGAAKLKAGSRLSIYGR